MTSPAASEPRRAVAISPEILRQVKLIELRYTPGNGALYLKRGLGGGKFDAVLYRGGLPGDTAEKIRQVHKALLRNGPEQ